MSCVQTSAIASKGLRAYGPGMAALRLLRILTLAALLLAPFGMLGNHASAARTTMAVPSGHHVAAMSAEHCADTGQPAKDRPSSSIDCMMACSAIAGIESELAEHPLPAAAPPEAMAPKAIHGLNPEADPPPPRLA
jgi:hypothetical protein